MSGSVRYRWRHASTWHEVTVDGPGVVWSQLRDRIEADNKCRGQKNGRRHEAYVIRGYTVIDYVETPLDDTDFIAKNSSIIVSRHPAHRPYTETYLIVPCENGYAETKWVRA